jgi:hypothetical protein
MHCFYNPKSNQLIVLDVKQQYSLSVKESVWKMLCDAMQDVYVDIEIFKKYDIEEEIVTVLSTI